MRQEVSAGDKRTAAKPAAEVKWSAPVRVAFRFAVAYILIYSAATQILGGILLLPMYSLPALGTVWPLRDVTMWTAERVVGATPPLVFAGNSGDTVFHWVQTALLLVAAAITAAIWSAVDRRVEHRRLHAWVRVFVRFAVAAQMFYYGMAKVIPSQFPPPNLVTLVSPVGSLSLSDLLWTFIGASTPYQVFTGAAEVLAGLLLLTPQTATLGALVACADMLQVFALNMAYDFGLKQISLHLFLMALFLLVPEFRRLAHVFVLNRPAPASAERPLFASPRANRRALAGQLMLGIYLLVMFAGVSARFYDAPGGPGAPKSPLYGIWEVAGMSVDGQSQPTILNDYDRRLRRVIFDAPDVVVFQRTDDSFAHYGVSIDIARSSLSLSKGTSRLWRAELRFSRVSEGQLLIEGEMDGRRLDVRLERVGLDTFRLLNSTFRWVRPPDPYAG